MPLLHEYAQVWQEEQPREAKSDVEDAAPAETRAMWPAQRLSRAARLTAAAGGALALLALALSGAPRSLGRSEPPALGDFPSGSPTPVLPPMPTLMPLLVPSLAPPLAPPLWPVFTVVSMWADPVLLLRCAGRLRAGAAPSVLGAAQGVTEQVDFVAAFLGNGSLAVASSGNARQYPLRRVAAVAAEDGQWRLTFEVHLQVPAALEPPLHLNWTIEYGSWWLALRDFSRTVSPAPLSFLSNGSSGSLEYKPPEAARSSQDSALADDSASGIWVMASSKARPQVLSPAGASACDEQDRPRAYGLVVLGDSQPDNMCKQLARRGANVTCNKVQVTVSHETVSSIGGTQLAIKLRELLTLYDTRDTVLAINLCGLFEAAWGVSNDRYGVFAERLLRIAATAKHALVVVMTTTALHPALYGALPGSDKWAMTNVRVQAQNDVVRAALARVNADPGAAARIALVDMEVVSLPIIDPERPTDMMHYSERANAALAQWLLCHTDALVAARAAQGAA
jgi:hypothetical protein